ncbi:MAG: hypothetical protein RJA36_3220 [Pseudomonadota bacterium]
MKALARTAAIATLAIGAASAQAQLYGELGYVGIRDKFSVAGTEYKPNLGALSATLGYGLHQNLAIEGMLAAGVKDDTVGGVKLELQHSVGVFLKPRVMLSPEFELFGRIGYVESKAKGRMGGASASDSSSDWAYGLGANYYFNNATYGTLSYMRLYDKDGEQVNGLTLGVGMKF